MPLITGHCLVTAILFKAIHKTVSLGSQEPKENTEHMAREVIKCIGYAVINKEPIQCFWGIGGNHRFVSNDESSLKAFNLHSIFRRQQHVLTSTVSIFCENKDIAQQGSLWRGSIVNLSPTTSDGKRLVSCITSVMRQGVTSLGDLGINVLACFYQTECYLLLWKMS